MATRHKVFVSYHHFGDQFYRNEIATLGRDYGFFMDRSVNPGDIDERLDDQGIRRFIRDRNLRDSTVTLVLVGQETRYRKHVDWEIYSSMYNGKVNKQSGVLVVNLPGVEGGYFQAGHGEAEKSRIYPAETNWTTITTRVEYERRFPFMPARLIDNLLAPKALISVVNWSTIQSDPRRLRDLIEVTHQDRAQCVYDLTRPMRRANSSERWR